MATKAARKKSALAPDPNSTAIGYLMAFVVGNIIAVLSGKLGTPLAQELPHSSAAALAWNILVTLLVYGLGFAVLLWFLLGRYRAAKPIVIGVLAAVALNLITLLTAWPIALVHLDSSLGATSMMVVVNVIYSLFFVVGWAVAKRVAAK